ncbi:MAG: aldehyde dehydrogenase family protein [Nocardioidaceae bacterium]
MANAARASRKDARDAVVAARKAFAGWATRTPYNRGQIMYRIAEVAEGRRDQLTDEVASAEGLSRSAAGKVVDAAVDRWVWYAGWADKFAQVAGNANAVVGPVLQPELARADRYRRHCRTRRTRPCSD